MADGDMTRAGLDPPYVPRSLGRGQVRSRLEIVRFFDGLDLVPPGVVVLPYWRPDVPVDSPPPAGSMLMLVGVALKP